MKKIIKKMLRQMGLEITRCPPDTQKKECITLKPVKNSKGNVLLSYVIDPFLVKEGDSVSTAHTHHLESLQIAQTFLDLGYCVDVIDFRDKTFIPKKDYLFFVAARTNFQRIAKLLNDNCVKIVHLDTAHWLFNSTTEYKRCLDLQQRRKVTLSSFRSVEPNWAIEHADYATLLGNQFTMSTYSYAQKPIFPIPIPTYTVYPSPENKNIESCRNHFLWFGGYGLVHKGLDLVLEAFATMPNHHLTVCGPIKQEKDFEQAYHKELYQLSNIHTVGWIDVSSSRFMEIANQCIALVYPSCSEGQSGAVVTCLQAGLIPIISYESGVDIDDFGVMLKDCSINTIKDSVEMISKLPAENLKTMSCNAWEYARTHHTKERFAENFRKAIETIISHDIP